MRKRLIEWLSGVSIDEYGYPTYSSGASKSPIDIIVPIIVVLLSISVGIIIGINI